MSKTNCYQQSGLPEDAAADPIRLLLRDGAQQLLANAIREELPQFLQDNSSRLTDDGRPAVVRNGYHTERKFLTPLGNLAVQVPKVRSRDDQQVFRFALVPPYVRCSQTLDAALP